MKYTILSLLILLSPKTVVAAPPLASTAFGANLVRDSETRTLSEQELRTIASDRVATAQYLHRALVRRASGQGPPARTFEAGTLKSPLSRAINDMLLSMGNAQRLTDAGYKHLAEKHRVAAYYAAMIASNGVETPQMLDHLIHDAGGVGSGTGSPIRRYFEMVRSEPPEPRNKVMYLLGLRDHDEFVEVRLAELGPAEHDIMIQMYQDTTTTGDLWSRERALAHIYSSLWLAGDVRYRELDTAVMSPGTATSVSHFMAGVDFADSEAEFKYRWSRAGTFERWALEDTQQMFRRESMLRRLNKR